MGAANEQLGKLCRATSEAPHTLTRPRPLTLDTHMRARVDIGQVRRRHTWPPSSRSFSWIRLTTSSAASPDRIWSSTYSPVSLERPHQSRRTMSRPFISRTVVGTPPSRSSIISAAYLTVIARESGSAGGGG